MRYIIFFLKPFYNNFNKRIVKTPKLYFYDTGLLCYLLGINNSSQIETHYLKGALFENLIIAEIIKNHYNFYKEPKCFFWYDKSGYEIDCIVETNRTSAFEIKKQ